MCLYSVCAHHDRNLLKSLVTVIRVTYFIFAAHTGRCQPKRTVKRQGEGLEKQQQKTKTKTDREWTTGNIKIRTRKRFVAYSWHKLMDNICLLWVLIKGDINLCGYPKAGEQNGGNGTD